MSAAEEQESTDITRAMYRVETCTLVSSEARTYRVTNGYHETWEQALELASTLWVAEMMMTRERCNFTREMFANAREQMSHDGADMTRLGERVAVREAVLIALRAASRRGDGIPCPEGASTLYVVQA